MEDHATRIVLMLICTMGVVALFALAYYLGGRAANARAERCERLASKRAFRDGRRLLDMEQQLHALAAGNLYRDSGAPSED